MSPAHDIHHLSLANCYGRPTQLNVGWVQANSMPVTVIEPGCASVERTTVACDGTIWNPNDDA